MPRAEPKPPPPIRTYGLPVLPPEHHHQLSYEMLAFRRKWPIAQGGLSRYEHFRNGARLLWPWLEWNPWMETQAQAFCENQWTAVAGCAGCVSGDTRILDPITGEQPTIEYLTRNQVAPMVMTLNGPERAEVPFVKGFEELFEVTLDDGTRFTATAEHLVLTPEGFSRVGALAIGSHLLGYDHVLPVTTSGGGRSVRASSAQSSRKTVEGCPAGCLPWLRSDDEQLLSAIAAAQSFVPSHNDAPTRSLLAVGDVQVSRFSRSPDEFGSSRRSMRDFFHHRRSSDIFAPHRYHPETYEHDARLCGWRGRSALSSTTPAPSSKRVHGYGHTRNYPSGSGCTPFDFQSCLRVSRHTVTSIRAAGHSVFFDITVPKAAHYFAEGSIHHNSCKTTVAVIYAAFWWLCGIHDSAVVLTSTTKGNIRSRAWHWVQRLYTGAPGLRIGNMVDSRTTWQGKKGDDRHCICALAVREGSTAKAVARIQGFHPDRLLIVVDEATDTPEAIFESFPNLISTPRDFQVIVLGNPNSKFDPFGKFCEPAGGWNSITVEDEEWETAPQLNMKPGVVIHLDAEKSPNVISDVAKWRYLPQPRKLDAMRTKLGPDSPQFYKFWRGFWCPEGILQTVLTESLLSKHNAAGGGSRHIFSGGPQMKIAFCDPAFGGGDRAVLKFALMGELLNGAMGIQLGKTQLLSINSRSAEPTHYQLAQQIQWHCRDQGVLPKYFGLDATGEGGGLADILMREWAPEIIRVEFGGRASDFAVSNEDARPCAEVYHTKVAELWYSIRELVVSEQLKGIDAAEARELTTRLWRERARRIEVEPKSKRKLTGDGDESSSWGFKERLGRSCDLGDAVAGICHVAKTHGAVTRVLGRTARMGADWLAAAKKLDEIYETGEPGPENEQWDQFALENL